MLEWCWSNWFFVVLPSSVTYLRLDGSVAAERRFEIVKAFNSDPTIDALLLTTHGIIIFSSYFIFQNRPHAMILLFVVGGLGLNLTSADTLVFMEHDWNPMRDHQVINMFCLDHCLSSAISLLPGMKKISSTKRMLNEYIMHCFPGKALRTTCINLLNIWISH